MRNFLRDIKISTKISVLVGLSVLSMASVVGIALRQTNTVGQEVEALAKEDITLLERLNNITFHELRQLLHLERAIQFGRRMAQDEAAKDKFEIERKNFLSHGQMITQEIDESRAFVERMAKKYQTTHRREKRILQVDYVLRTIDKEHADYQFLAERALNQLSQGKLADAEPVIQKITEQCKEKEHFRLDKSLESLKLAVKGFAEDSIVRTEDNKQSAVIHMLLVSALILLLSISLGIFVSHRIRKSLRVAVNIAERITAGDRNVEIEAPVKDETGLLLQAMKTMSFSIGQAEESLKQQASELAQSNSALQKEIAERKKAEQELERLNKDLESTVHELNRSNKELQGFAHIIAHDLKAPLRGIATLADWISTDYSGKLDARGKEQIELLKGRTKRMSEFIDGILRYSEIGRVAHDRTELDLNTLITELIVQIAPPQNIEITIENELPIVICERILLMRVFQNLLNNAVRYMDKPQGQVRVGCVEEDSFWRFSVADNGLGIEERHFEKIFQLFQTLSPRDKNESVGIGLTIAKKIVELYEGRIWVESKLGEGSTFFFTLPKQEMGIKNEKRQASIIS